MVRPSTIGRGAKPVRLFIKDCATQKQSVFKIKRIDRKLWEITQKEQAPTTKIVRNKLTKIFSKKIKILQKINAQINNFLKKKRRSAFCLKLNNTLDYVAKGILCDILWNKMHPFP